MYPGIVGVESDDVFNPHRHQLLEHQRAVERLPAAAAVLPPFVEHRHDDVDPAGLAVGGGNHPLQVSEMVIGAHRHRHPVHLVGDAVVKAVDQDKNVVAADGLLQCALCLAVAETGAGCFQQIGVPAVADKIPIFHQLSMPLAPPAGNIVIHLGGHLFAAFHADDAQRPYWDRNLMNRIHISKLLLCVYRIAFTLLLYLNYRPFANISP